MVKLDRSKEVTLSQLHAPGPTNKECEHVFFPLTHMETHVQHVLMDTQSQPHRSIQTGHSRRNKLHNVPLATHNVPLFQSRVLLQLVRLKVHLWEIFCMDCADFSSD